MTLRSGRNPFGSSLRVMAVVAAGPHLGLLPARRRAVGEVVGAVASNELMAGGGTAHLRVTTTGRPLSRSHVKLRERGDLTGSPSNSTGIFLLAFHAVGCLFFWSWVISAPVKRAALDQRLDDAACCSSAFAARILLGTLSASSHEVADVGSFATAERARLQARSHQRGCPRP